MAGNGAIGVLTRRNAIIIFMCVELMFNAVNLSLVTFSRINGTLDGQIMAFFVMVVAAAEGAKAAFAMNVVMQEEEGLGPDPPRRIAKPVRSPDIRIRGNPRGDRR